MHPARKYWFWTLWLTVGLLAPALLWSTHANSMRRLAWTGRINLFVFGAVASLALLGLLLAGLRFVFQRYVYPLRRLAEDVEALTHGSGQAALGAYPDPPVSVLAAALQELLRQRVRPEHQVHQELRRARADLTEQHDREERILDTLAVPVVVCSRAGRIQRYNRSAREVPSWRPWLGIGRSLHPLLEPACIAAAIAHLDAQFAAGQRYPVWEGTLAGRNGPDIDVRLTPLLDPVDQIDGLVLAVKSPPGGKAPRPSTPQSVSPTAPPVLEQAAPLLELAEQPLAAVRFVVIDTETTGLDPARGDEIVELAGVPVVDGHVLADEAFHTLVDPGRPSTPTSLRIHGITPEMVRGKPEIEEVLPDFARFVSDAVLVAHNAAFDLRFLRQKAPHTGLHWPHPALDTMLLSSLLHPQQRSHGLDALIARYGIDMQGRHSAIGDALMTAQLLLLLLPQLQRRGILTVRQAMAAVRKTPPPRTAH